MALSVVVYISEVIQQFLFDTSKWDLGQTALFSYSIGLFLIISLASKKGFLFPGFREKLKKPYPGISTGFWRQFIDNSSEVGAACAN